MGASTISIVVATILCLAAGSVSAIIPIKCSHGSNNCTLQNYQGIWVDRAPCLVASVAYPTTEKELIAAVAKGVKQKQNIKMVSKLSHSLPKLACPRGSSGLLISTSNYNSNITIDQNAKTVTVDAGVELQDLLSKLAEQGLALPCTPYFNGLSVAGVISTGAHGSSLQGRGGAVHESVVGISLVVPATRKEGHAKLIKLTQADADLNAARLSIGVLGAISQVSFAVNPLFKRSITKQVKDDSSLEDDVVEIGKNFPFGDINWYPNQKKILVRLDDKVPVSTPGQGRNTNSQPAPASSIRRWRVQEEDLWSKQNDSLVCAASQKGIEYRLARGDGHVNDGGTFKGYPIVGFNHLMETGGGCQNAALNNSKTQSGDKLTCAWDPEVPGQFYFHTSIAIPLSKIKQAIADIKQIRDKNPQNLCALNLYGGATFRFVKGSSAYLASPVDSVYFEMLYFRDRHENTPRLNEDAMEEVEQMLLKKHEGKPHWGKNRDFTFENIRSKTVNLTKFLEVRKRLDPQGIFSSEWSDAVLGIHRCRTTARRNVSTVKKYCALEGLCICSQDRHCAPEKGYFCRSGDVFRDAQVCRKTTQ